MALYLRAKKLDFSSGGYPWVVIIQEKEAEVFGIILGDFVEIEWHKHRVNVVAYYTRKKVEHGQIGLFKEIWKNNKVDNGEPISIKIISRPPSIRAIRKKLLRGTLSYKEIYSIIKDIVDNKLSNVEITYFVASSFIRRYSNEELFYLTKAMAETGDTLKFHGKIVADKHSIGGLAGNRTSMIIVPIVASLGIVIPKTSSRSVTSPAGTADSMEVLAPVSLSLNKVKKIIKKNNGCLIWGGAFNIAPADDRLIQVSHPIAVEPYNKMLVSIMAKKVAMGITHLIIDLPYGPLTKVSNLRTANYLKRKFLFLAKKFRIKIKVILSKTVEPVGRGVGPTLEARDVLRVLQRKKIRPLDLEKKALRLAGQLIELTGKVKKGKGFMKAKEVLESGQAWKKMQAIIKCQGGKPNIDSEDLTLAAKRHRVCAPFSGKIVFVNNRAIDDIARILGAPHENLTGIYINKRLSDEVKKGDRLFTLYAQSRDRVKLAEEALKKIHIFKIKNLLSHH